MAAVFSALKIPKNLKEFALQLLHLSQPASGRMIHDYTLNIQESRALYRIPGFQQNMLRPFMQARPNAKVTGIKVMSSRGRLNYIFKYSYLQRINEPPRRIEKALVSKDATWQGEGQ